MIRYCLYSLILFLLFACGASRSLMRPNPEDVVKLEHAGMSASIETLETGFKLYKNNCGGCHALYKPSAYSWKDWEKLLPEMFHETPNLKAKEQQLITMYLMAKS